MGRFHTRRLIAALCLLTGLLGCSEQADARHRRHGDHQERATVSSNLPPEAVQTLRLIQQGGPFPYDRDGVVFGNFERRLPNQARGYYHEYTVKTPGERTRGARRIIAGGNPPVVYYYTDDHYKTFRDITDEARR